jgi:PAT family beta-lactamase induction signal transducer AmpG
LLGGVVVARFGVMRPLFVCAILAACSNLLFYWVAVDGREMLEIGRCADSMCLADPWSIKGGDVEKLILTISAENIIGGMAGTVLIAYLSGLTNAAYTATQYALFSSFMSLVGKMVASTSGLIVDETSYSFFFVYTTLMGIPAVLLVLVLMAAAKRVPRRANAPALGAPKAAAAATAPRAGE